MGYIHCWPIYSLCMRIFLKDFKCYYHHECNVTLIIKIQKVLSQDMVQTVRKSCSKRAFIGTPNNPNLCLPAYTISSTEAETFTLKIDAIMTMVVKTFGLRSAVLRSFVQAIDFSGFPAVCAHYSVHSFHDNHCNDMRRSEFDLRGCFLHC